MAEQPHLFSPDSPEGRPTGAPSGVAPKTSERPVSALVRIESIIRILVRLYLGVVVAVLPWLSFWAQNNLFTYSPVLAWLADSGFFRGVVSGLGLLNIVMAVIETKRSRLLS